MSEARTTPHKVARDIVIRNLRDSKYHGGLIEDIAAALKAANKRADIESNVADTTTAALTEALATIAALQSRLTPPGTEEIERIREQQDALPKAHWKQANVNGETLLRALDAATAESATLRVALAQCAGVICESGNLNNYRNLSDRELGDMWVKAATFAADTLNSVTAGKDFLDHHRATVVRATSAEAELQKLREERGLTDADLDEIARYVGVPALKLRDALAIISRLTSPPTKASSDGGV